MLFLVEKKVILVYNVFKLLKILKEVRLMEATTIKKVVAMGIGAAIYIVLSRFVAILGTILIFAFSKTIVSKGSLKQE